MGEGLRVMQGDFVCHYFIDLDKIMIVDPCLADDDALYSVGSRNQRSTKLTSKDNQGSPTMHDYQAQHVAILPSIT